MANSGYFNTLLRNVETSVFNYDYIRRIEKLAWPLVRVSYNPAKSMDGIWTWEVGVAKLTWRKRLESLDQHLWC